MLWKKTKLTSDEYDMVTTNIKEMRSSLNNISDRLDHIETKQNSLRGLVNKKLSGIAEEEESENSKYKDFQ